MPPKRLVINNMPLRSGLATAGKQGTIGEDQLWRAENMSSGLDGLLSKRPGIRQWGQTIKQPRANASGEYFNFYEPFSSTAVWGVTNGDPATFTHQVKQGELTVAVEDTNDNTYLFFGRSISGGELEPTSHDFSLRLVIRALNLPRGDGDTSDTTAGGTNDGGTLSIFARSDYSEIMRSFRLFYDGVYCRNTGSWVRIATSPIGDGQYHSIEIRFDATANCEVYVDEVLVSTTASSFVEEWTGVISGSSHEHLVLAWSNDAGTWTCKLTDLMFKDSVEDPFVGERIDAVTDFKTTSTAGSAKRILLVATPRYIYADIGLRLVWSPILALTGGQAQFASYRQDMIIFDTDMVRLWNGEDEMEILEDAPPVRFGTEHGTRLFAAGDRNHPRRVYFTASREANTWFAPDVDPDETFDEVTEAGYHEIPGSRGDEVTGLHGDFANFCFVTTTRGLWVISGVGPETYTRSSVSRSQNGAGPMSITRVGNDLWTLGRTGVANVQTTQNYGDLLTVLPSAPIGNLWSADPNIPNRLDQSQIDKAIIAYNPVLGLVYLVVPVLGQNDLSAIYCCNIGLQTWHGPWVTDTTALACVEIADPVTSTMLHGSSDGRVGITDLSYKMDYGDTRYTTIFESPSLSGRSLDPAITKLIKTWKTLRLYIMPRGEWNITVRWSADDDKAQSITVSQNAFKFPALSDTFRLGDSVDGLIHTDQLIGVLDITLDARGRYFKFTVETDDDNDGEDFVLQGYEVEFIPNGLEQEGE